MLSLPLSILYIYTYIYIHIFHWNYNSETSVALGSGHHLCIAVKLLDPRILTAKACRKKKWNLELFFNWQVHPSMRKIITSKNSPKNPLPRKAEKKNAWQCQSHRTFEGCVLEGTAGHPLPRKVRCWCRKSRRFLALLGVILLLALQHDKRKQYPLVI